MQHPLLLVGALLLGIIGFMHSYLGERFVLSRILALPDLPKLRGSRAYMQSLLRWAWHLTSIAWWGTSVTLIALWTGRGLAAIGAITAATFALHGLIIVIVNRRHPAWPLFFLAAAAIWLGSR